MSLSAAAIRMMAEKGLSALDIAEIAEACEPASTSGAARQARYRERLGIPQSQWATLASAVVERDGLVCAYCLVDIMEAGAGHAIDHVHPLILGGDNSLDNLVVACKPCNSSKAGRSIEEWSR